MRKYPAFGLILCLLLASVSLADAPAPTTAAPASKAPSPTAEAKPAAAPIPPPPIGSPAAALFDATTGQFLFEKAGDTQMFPASTTKILTALIILETSKLTDQVTTPANFVNPGGSHIAIDHGEILTVEQLLHATLIESANDAAALLAIHHSGSIEAFSKVMNDRAKKIGAKHSNFVNPHGLHNPLQVTTAKDLALIAAEAMKNTTFRTIVKTPRYTIPPTNKKTEARSYLRTSNRFVRDTGANMTYNGKKIPIYDSQIDGVKTGYTTEANNCLVSSKIINGTRYISVVLGAGVDNLVYVDSKALLDYGAKAFKSERFISEGEVVTNIKVPNAQDAGLNLVAKATLTRTISSSEAEAAKIERVVELYDLPNEPITRGMPLGVVKFVKDKAVLASTELLAERDIVPQNLLGDVTVMLSAKSVLESPVDIAIIVGKLLLAFIIWRTIIVRRNRKRRRLERQAKIKAIHESKEKV